MKKLLKIFAVMFIVSVALLAVAAYVPNGDVADAVTADCTHEYSEVVLAQQPSCTQKGWLEHYTCTLCGKYFVKVGEDMVEVDREDIYSPVLVHKWSDWFVKPATCTEEGGEMRYCALCGATEHRGETIDATGHTYDAVTTENNVCTVCEHEITQAEIVEKLYALESGKALGGTYLLTGIVTNVDDTNATIIVEEKEIYLYSFQSTDTFLVGDRVSVVGTLKHFGNYYEFDAGTVTKVTHPEYALTFGVNVEGYTVTLADGSPVPTSATNGTTYEVKITVPSGYKVASVTVNGAVVDMSESGTYSVTVCGETTVHVEIVSKMSQQEVVLTFPDGNSAKISSYTNEWSVTLGENTWNITNANNNNNGWDYIRIGAKSSTSTSTISFTSEKSVSKIVVYTAYIRGSATATLSVVNSQGETILSTEPQTIGNGTESVAFDVSGAKQNCTYVLTFVCTNTNSKHGVIDISKVTYTSVICDHEWGTWAHKSDATCTESATESRICDLCGAEEVRTVGEPLGHTWGDWTSNGNGTHTGTCTREGCDYTVKEDCTFVDGVCSVCHAQEVITHSVTVGYTVNGNAATTLPEGVTVEILGEDGQSVTDLANVVEGTTLKVKITAEGFDIAVTCNSESLTLQDGEGAFVVDADVTLSVTLTTHTQHKGTAEDPYSVADALAIAGAIGQGNYTEKVYIKGLIVDVGSDRGDFRSNIYIADTADGTKMLVFSANFSEEVPSIYEGDTVVFHGYITNYEGILEIAPHGDYVYMTAVTRGSRPIAVTMENATIATPTGDLPTSAPIESTVTFTVTPDEGYEVVSVKVNGNFITPVDGTYSFVVGETNAVEVTIQKITPKHQVSVSSDVEGYTVTTDNDITLPGEVYEGTLKFTVTAPEGYQVATVSVGETVLTLGDDGYYTTEVAGEITINVTFKIITKVSLELTSANLGLERYNTSIKTVTVDGVDFEYLQLMKSTQYSNSIQMKSGDGYVNNVTPFGVSISQITLKAAKDLASAKVQVEMKKAEGDWVTIGTYVASDFADNQVTIPVDLAENYLYVKVSSASGALYFTSITIECEKLCEHVVETWTPNNDGTHSGECTICGETVTEDCTYKDGKCTVCEAVQPSHSITVEIANGRVTDLNGESLSATALHGTELSFKVAVDEGYVVDKVMVNGEPVDAVDGVYTVIIKGDTSIVVSTRDAATTVTVTWETFTSTSDAKDDISYTTAKGEGTSDPAINDGEIRLYQNSSDGKGGGEITVTAGNGKTITAISIGSSMETSVKYSYVNAEGVTVEKTVSLSADDKIDLSDVNATSITFTCMGTSKSTRFYVNYLSVTYR